MGIGRNNPKYVKISSLLFISFLVPTLLSGCMYQGMRKDIRKETSRAKVLYAKKPTPATNFEVRKDAWLADSSDWINPQKVYPPIFHAPVHMTIATPSDIYQIGEKITNVSGIPVTIHVGRDIRYAMSNQTSPSSTPGAGMPGSTPGMSPMGMTGGGMPGSTGMMPGMTGSSPSPGGISTSTMTGNRGGGSGYTDPTMFMRVTIDSFNGTLKGFLDLVAARMGLFWDYDGTKIYFQRYQTQVFRIKAPTSQTSVQDSISDVGSIGNAGLQQALMSSMMAGGGLGGGLGSGIGGGLGGGLGLSGISGGMGGQSQGQTVSLSSSSTVWSEISNSLTSILMDQGAYTTSPSTGTVTVTTSPSLMLQVSKYIHKINSQLSRQVWIKVTLLDVQLTDSEATDVNWTAVLKGIAGAFPGAGVAASSLGSAGSSQGLTPVGSATFTLPNTSTTTVISNIEQQGRTSIITTAKVLTLNHQTSPVQAVQTISYLAGSLSGAAGLGSSTFTSLMPGAIMVGYTMDLTPHLMHDNDMLLELTLDSSQLIAMNTYTSGSQSLQLPNVNSRSFMQRVRVHSGDTIVISGFQQTNNTLTQQGIGSPDNFILGGGDAALKQHEVLVILVKPIITR